MAKQGYQAEYKCKKENEEIYGIGNVIKVAIGGSSDFMIAYQGKIVKFIEVKETKKDIFYASKREQKQFGKLIWLGKHHHVPVELWVYFKRKKGRPAIKHIRHIYNQPNSKYETKETEKTSRGNFKVTRGQSAIVPKQRENIRERSSTETQQERQKAFWSDNSKMGTQRKIF